MFIHAMAVMINVDEAEPKPCTKPTHVPADQTKILWAYISSVGGTEIFF